MSDEPGMDEIGDEPLDFDKIKIEEPEISNDGSQDNAYHGGGIGEEEDNAKVTSDFKALLTALNPTIKDKRLSELLQTSRVSRIFPENYLDKTALMVGMLVMEQEAFKPFDFIGLLNHVQDANSFGYEGRGIADILEAFGAVKEQDLEKISKDLGLG